MEKYNLVILLRLRDKKVHKMTKVSDLFFSCKTKDQEALADEVTSRHGDGVLFILDGFDEFPVTLQHEGFIIDLITKTLLPESTVVVTSRPSATAELLTSCQPLIQKHVEILGFTQESVEAYAASIFSDLNELESFKTYISASESPAINSLMYVPINAAIVVRIYMESKSRSALPRNLTQLYTQLCLTILNKYMKIEYPSVRINKFKSLPDDLYQQFIELSRIAFEGIKNHQVILHDDSIPPNFNHFGFLDAVSTLYGGEEISYNFLHLTLQEFFAAYHISQLPDSGVTLFGIYGKHERWNVVWRFVAGLTKFHYLDSHAKSSAFCNYSNDRWYLKTFLIQCLFEAQISLDFESAFGTKECGVELANSPFDSFALGYCIANCSTKMSSWRVHCQPSMHFIYGLMTETSPNIEHGIITQLYIDYSPYEIVGMKIQDQNEFLHTCINELATLLSAIVYLTIEDFELFTNESTLHNLIKFIQQLPNLKKLRVNGSYNDGEPEGEHGIYKLLQQLHDSNVTTLDVRGTEMEFYLKHSFLAQDHLDALHTLIHPSSGTLQELVVSAWDEHSLYDINIFVRKVSSPSSLRHLSIACAPLTSFNSINNLTKLTVICRLWSELVEDIFRILEESKTLKYLHLSPFTIPDDTDTMLVIATALQENSTLQTLEFSPEDFSFLDLVSYSSKEEDFRLVNIALHEIDARANFTYQSLAMVCI